MAPVPKPRRWPKEGEQVTEKYERAIAEFDSREFESLLHEVQLAGWH